MLKYLILKGVLVIMMEKMLNDETEVALAALLNMYIKNNGLNDKKFILECVDVIYSLNDLNGYLKHLRFINMPKNTNAAYSIKKRTIKFNNQYLNKNKNKKHALEKKISILGTTLHEISHAFQMKKIEQDNDMEAKLLRADFDLKRSNFNNKLVNLFFDRMYDKLYLCFPSERLAIYNSSETLINILNLLKYQDPDIDKYINKYKKDCFLELSDDYVYIINGKISNFPFKKFANFHDEFYMIDPVVDEELFRLLSESSLTLKEDFIYGFPIEVKNHSELKKTIKLFK